MIKPKELFELDIVTENPLFEGFSLESSPSLIGRSDLEEDITPGYAVSEKIRKWEPIVLSDVWKAPKVVGRVATFNDFPGINMILPAFSDRACEVLHDFLEPNGELLPLNSDMGRYFFYNITNIVDALDVENSVCDFWCDPPTTAIDIEYFAFREEEIIGQHIFRIYEDPILTIVSDIFVKRVYESGLNGFRFNKIWPFPKDVNWRTYNKQKFQNKEDKRLKQNTVVIILLLDSEKPNSEEVRQIKKLENELDAQLWIPQIDSPYFGCYEGNDIVNSEYRMFISCPDAVPLEKKLHPWLKELKWGNKVYAIKRYGEIHDVQAKEEMIDI